MTPRLIKLKEVLYMTGLGRSSIYKFMDEGGFPQSISLGARAVAWGEHEVQQWIAQRIEHRDANILSGYDVEVEL